jgi:NAD(P)-dependent dehydrogenase (short-subunit alcohol dehydrogenase family)
VSTPVVLITGALTGIGRATAFAFANEGARLVVSGRNEERGKALVSELRVWAWRQTSSSRMFGGKKM